MHAKILIRKDFTVLIFHSKEKPTQSSKAPHPSFTTFTTTLTTTTSTHVFNSTTHVTTATMSKPTSPSSSSQQQQQQTIDLTSLSLQNLSSVKQQLDTELEHLSTSFTKLRTAQTKFKECIRSISTGVKPSLEGRQILVPLTSSLYVPGTLKEGGKVIVDVGTGYYVEKKTKDAIKFYEGKVETIGGNLVDLEKIITAKTQNLKVVEDVIRQKVLAGGAPTA